MKNHHVLSLGQLLFKLNHYLRYGYVYYYARSIPYHKDVRSVDTKLVLLYDVTYNRNLRAKRKKKGVRNVVYLRYKQDFILLATEGTHRQFDRVNYLDLREVPFVYCGYSVMVKGQKPSIKLEAKRYNEARKTAKAIAHHHYQKVETFLMKVSPFSFEGVNQQRWKLYKLVNQKRKAAGLRKITWNYL